MDTRQQRCRIQGNCRNRRMSRNCPFSSYCCNIRRWTRIRIQEDIRSVLKLAHLICIHSTYLWRTNSYTNRWSHTWRVINWGISTILTPCCMRNFFNIADCSCRPSCVSSKLSIIPIVESDAITMNKSSRMNATSTGGCSNPLGAT